MNYDDQRRILVLSLSTFDNMIRHQCVTREETQGWLFSFAASDEHTYSLHPDTFHAIKDAENESRVGVWRRIIWRHVNEPSNTRFHMLRTNLLLAMHGYRQVPDNRDYAVLRKNVYDLADDIRHANEQFGLIVIDSWDSLPQDLYDRYVE